MRNKQSGNLNREKSRISPGGKLSYSFFSGQNLLENVIKHCLPVFSRFPPMTCSRLTLLLAFMGNCDSGFADKDDHSFFKNHRRTLVRVSFCRA